MPRVSDHVFNNGTRLVVVPRSDQDLVTVTMHLMSGSAHDVNTGATSFAAELLTRGTERLTAEEFDELVEYHGCTIRSAAQKTSVTLQGLGLVEQLGHVISLMAECVTTPRFDARELEVVRGRWMSELEINQRDPDWLASQASNKVCYANHPYARRNRGSAADMANITTDKIRAAHERLLASQRTIIIAGPVELPAVLPMLEPFIHALPQASFDAGLPQAHMRERTAVVAKNPGAVQSAFRISLPCVPYSHPDFSGLQLVANVLGGYTLARLFMVLREQKGYTYGAYAVPVVRQHAQTVDVVTSVGNTYTADTLATIADEVRRIASQLIPAEELDDARQQLLGSFARTNETPQQTASLIWQTIHHNLPLDYHERHVQRLQMFQPEDLLLIQQRYFDADRWAIGCSGVPDVLLPVVEQYADAVEHWDPLAD